MEVLPIIPWDIGDVLKTLVEHCKGKVLNIYNTQYKELERYIRVICNCKVQNCYTIAEIRCSLYLGLTKKISFSCLSKSYEYGVPITTLKRYKDKMHPWWHEYQFSQLSLCQFNHYCAQFSNEEEVIDAINCLECFHRGQTGFTGLQSMWKAAS